MASDIRDSTLSATVAGYKTQLRDAGYCLLPGLLPLGLIETAWTEYLQLFQRLLQDPAASQLQTSHSGSNHYQVQPQFSGVFGDPDLFAHRDAMSALRAVLGEDCKIAYYNSNIAAPGSTVQNVHRDTRLLFERGGPTPAYLMVVNVLLSDFTDENGSTEVWPGSHLMTDEDHEIYPHDLDARAGMLPSVRLNAPAGSLVIRDARLWHRGMPNSSAAPRAMLSLVYKRKWHSLRYDRSLQAPPEVADKWPDDVQALFS